jgi:hypothetical protein
MRKNSTRSGELRIGSRRRRALPLLISWQSVVVAAADLRTAAAGLTRIRRRRTPGRLGVRAAGLPGLESRRTIG